MTFHLLPYIEVDGIRTVPDSDIKRLFKRTEDDGLVPIVFCDDSITTAGHFINMAKFRGTMFFLIMDGTETIGYTWLNRIENRMARNHFCVFKAYWGKTLEIGKWVLAKLINAKDKNGKYCFDLFTGLVPVWNERAVNFALKCGGKTHGTIPNAIWNNAKKQSEDAVLIYHTRGAE